MDSTREDLLRLSPEALAQAANLGLVKRAVKELEAGSRPELSLDENNTLTARFGDGVTTVWDAEKPIQQTRCTCGANPVCRHRIMAALAYRADAEQAPAPLTPPVDVSDETLARLLPPRTLALAQSLRGQGLAVELRVQGEPCPTARLPAATVRFWGGPAIEAARCDCVQAVACEHVALAVWAFQAAGSDSGQVILGEAAPGASIDRSAYHALAESLLQHGVKRGAAAHLQALSRALQAAEQAGAVWLRLLLAELETWLGAYAARSARYQAEDGLKLLAELSLRLAAGGQPGQTKPALGLGEAGEVEMDRLRLVSLGCRIDRDGDTRRLRQILADSDTGTRFVLNHQWQVSENADELAAASSQRLAPGVRLAQLAGGQLLSQQAKRRADGSLTLAKTRSAQNSLLPQAGDWASLGQPLRFESVADLRQDKQTHPIPQTTPRHAAASFTVLRVEAVETVFYDPNAQTLIGVVLDRDGEAVVVKRSHEGHLRHALDASAGALSGQFGPLAHVAGLLSWEHGRAVIEPWAFAAGRVIVPDLEPACGALSKLPLGSADGGGAAGVDAVLAGLESELAALAHHGLAELGGAWHGRCAHLAGQLRSLSLTALADALTALLEETRQASAKPDGGGLAKPLLYLAGLAALHREAAAMV